MSYTNGIGNTQLLLTAVSTTGISAAARTQTGETSADTAATTGAIEAGDHTTFSTAGSLIAQPAGDSDVRMEKVAALQQAIAAGTYNVSASDVADKLIKVLTN